MAKLVGALPGTRVEMSVVFAFVRVRSEQRTSVCVRSSERYVCSTVGLAAVLALPMSVGPASRNGVDLAWLRRARLGNSESVGCPGSSPLRLWSRPVCLFVSYCPSAIWLILPVVICLSQRLSHACLSSHYLTVKPRMAH